MADNSIYVTKTFLPPREEFDRLIDDIWESHHLTNNGPLLKTFEERVSKYLGVKNFQFLANGTLALQLAIDGLGIADGEIITTPFSYVATTSAILWQRCRPVYVDIDRDTLCIDPSKIEESITKDTKAILAVHVFGNACDVEAIQKIADKHNLKVIYDGAHAFGATYGGKSLLDYGDVSITSFHSTKPFHTIEGGGIFAKDEEVNRRINLAKRFGHNGDIHTQLGINAKANEFQAAMGLANLRYIDDIIQERKRISSYYMENMPHNVEVIQPRQSGDFEYNYAYLPILLETESYLIQIKNALEESDIYPRRYFYPSLNTLSYLDHNMSCSISEDLSTRVLCLPMYHGIEEEVVERVCNIISRQINS